MLRWLRATVQKLSDEILFSFLHHYCIFARHFPLFSHKANGKTIDDFPKLLMLPSEKRRLWEPESEISQPVLNGLDNMKMVIYLWKFPIITVIVFILLAVCHIFNLSQFSFNEMKPLISLKWIPLLSSAKNPLVLRCLPCWFHSVGYRIIWRFFAVTRSTAFEIGKK